jgi:cardiolipin synthase
VPPLVAWLTSTVALVAGLAAAGHALLWKRRPQAAFGWIAVCLSLPFAGALLYFLFGINRVETRARKLRDATAGGTPRADAAPPDDRGLVTLGARLSGRPLTDGNQVEPLHNGEQAYRAMLDAIDGARSRIVLSTYIFDSGTAGTAFARALGTAAARGVDVRVLVDGVGELYSWPPARRLLRGTPVRYARFLPPTLLPPTFQVNLRNHRKVLVVDGRTAFTGGMNITSRSYVDAPDNASPVVDLHFRIEGPVVTQIEDVFTGDWLFATGEDAPPAAPAATTASPVAGSARCRAIDDGPDGARDRLVALLIGAVGSARTRVAIMTPYFLPPRELMGPLLATAMRGVEVSVILPERNNLPYVHRATRHMLWELLQRGVRVCYQPPPFVHSKLLLVDDDYALVGSANLDPRSLRLNFELQVEVYDRDVVAHLDAHVSAARALAREVTLAEVDARPLDTRLVDGAAWLFSPYL